MVPSQLRMEILWLLAQNVLHNYRETSCRRGYIYICYHSPHGRWKSNGTPASRTSLMEDTLPVVHLSTRLVVLKNRAGVCEAFKGVLREKPFLTGSVLEGTW